MSISTGKLPGDRHIKVFSRNLPVNLSLPSKPLHVHIYVDTFNSPNESPND